MTSGFFTYDKPKVIQALRYHFISRSEIRVLLIMVNIFAIGSAILFYLKKINPLAFLMSSVLWFALMITFWFLLPALIYRRAKTFKDKFRATFNSQGFSIENEQGSRSWPWAKCASWTETPLFFYIYFDSRSFFLVPKDAFEDAGEARSILRENLKKQ